MKRGAALAAVLAVGLAVCGTARAANVTANRTVASEVSLAQAYWHVQAPALVASCPVQVFAGPLTAALGNAGVTEPAVNVWAETVTSSCTIVISSDMWQAATRGNAQDIFNTCVAFAHEYGHTLGLPDEGSPAIMNYAWTTATRIDPLCAQYAYGWAKISRANRTWLAANGLARHREMAADRSPAHR